MNVTSFIHTSAMQNRILTVILPEPCRHRDGGQKNGGGNGDKTDAGEQVGHDGVDRDEQGGHDGIGGAEQGRHNRINGGEHFC